MDGSSTRARSLPLPEPPFGLDLLADYHAGALDPATQNHLRSQLAADPQSTVALAAFDRVQADLRRYRAVAPTMPDDVAARLDSLIHTLLRG